MVNVCQGTGSDHCCWVRGKVCQHFMPDAPDGLRCSLRAELGSWTAVYVDARYPFDPARLRCDEFPTVGSCSECGLSAGGG